MISNASPLIVAAKTGFLSDLLELYRAVEVSPRVYQEILAKGEPDAILLEATVREGRIKVVSLTIKSLALAKKIKENYTLDLGEAETIALAIQLHRKELLMDEALGRKAAQLFSITPRGTLRVLLELYKCKKITEEKLKIKVQEIIGNQFRLDAEVLARFWELWEKMS